MDEIIILGTVILVIAYHFKIQSMQKQIDRRHEKDEDNDILLEYSLRCIIKEYIDKEDFENAEKCRKLLEKYDKKHK